MSDPVNIYEAKTQLSKLVDRAADGEEIVIARNGKPAARLVPIQRSVGKRRIPGTLRGKIWVAPDFDEPDPELESLFYDGPVFPDEDK